MELISQRIKGIMEGCKERAREAGLKFDNETLEYIVTNRDLIRLSPKVMIPTLYDYWIHDVEVHRGQRIYDVYPHNPYETVINTRPAVSFYNDNNPDWLNIMIFYHVLGHIDFFQNNLFFSQTWNDDFAGVAAADKRLIEKIRGEKGEEKRWVDYVIEFARGIDNLVGYYAELDDFEQREIPFSRLSDKLNFFFGPFLERLKGRDSFKRKAMEVYMNRYNDCVRQHGDGEGEKLFFLDPVVTVRHPEFEEVFRKHLQENKEKSRIRDVIQYILENSEFLRKKENKWMKQVIQVVRNTSLFFQPQIRTKIINEGWASYWHQELFLKDARMRSNEVKYAAVNAGVMALPKVGLNPYALGYLLLDYVREMAEKGKFSFEFQALKDAGRRRKYDKNLGLGAGEEALFTARETLSDFLFVNLLSKDDFQNFVDKHKLFVAGERINPVRRTKEYYIKSRSGEEYRKMLNNYLYHPPYVFADKSKTMSGELYLNHLFEERSLLTKWIPAVLRGVEYLWGNTVKLETTEFEVEKTKEAVGGMYSWWHGMMGVAQTEEPPPLIKKVRVLYTMSKGKIKRDILKEEE